MSKTETPVEPTNVLPTKRQFAVALTGTALTVATGVLTQVAIAKISDRILNHNKNTTETE